MIIGPTSEELLDALATFLSRDVVPRLRAGGDSASDAGLAFRTLIAANVAATLAAEQRLGSAIDAAQRSRLGALGFRDGARGTESLEGDLVAALRRGDVGEAGPGSLVWAHARASLVEMLSAVNPRFDVAWNRDAGPAGGAQ
ncbi:MAG: hypothetical protein IV100_27975 [Myxococcales bacterium]|nr:hypothetical protein [Myxococcales bacterium]